MHVLGNMIRHIFFRDGEKSGGGVESERSCCEHIGALCILERETGDCAVPDKLREVSNPAFRQLDRQARWKYVWATTHSLDLQK
jgi:hypothetical protein